MKRPSTGMFALAWCAAVVACGSGDPAEEFTNSLHFGVPAMKQSGSMPEGSSDGPQVVPLGGGPMTVSPGTAGTLSVPWSGGAVQSINIGFGGGAYFQVPVPNAAGQSSGMIQVPVDFGDFCANLGDVCHQIKCYEQVTTASGTVSKAAAQDMVLNCTGGRDCNGDLVGTCTSAGACTNGGELQACADSQGACWYDLAGTIFRCASGCNCEAAAEAAVRACSL